MPPATAASSQSSKAMVSFFGSMLEQLCFDLEDCMPFEKNCTFDAQNHSDTIEDAVDIASITADIDADLDDLPEINLSDPIQKSAKQSKSTLFPSDLETLETNHGKYIHFALGLLLTCAEDLSDADEMLRKSSLMLDKPDLDIKQLQKAKQLIQKASDLREDTVSWLQGKVQSLFSFDNCVELLEQELLIQSSGQVNIPDIMNRRDHLSEWILQDPETAKKMLSRYKSIFSEDNKNDLDGDFDSDLGVGKKKQTQRRSMNG